MNDCYKIINGINLFDFKNFIVNNLPTKNDYDSPDNFKTKRFNQLLECISNTNDLYKLEQIKTKIETSGTKILNEVNYMSDPNNPYIGMDILLEAVNNKLLSTGGRRLRKRRTNKRKKLKRKYSKTKRY